LFCRKREVNKKVLKVPGIEQKVEDSARAALSHTTISWANSSVRSYFPLPVVGKRMMFTVLICPQILDATSNEPWGPHGSLLADIAQATNN
jgi:hypothetical protein